MRAIVIVAVIALSVLAGASPVVSSPKVAVIPLSKRPSSVAERRVGLVRLEGHVLYIVMTICDGPHMMSSPPANTTVPRARTSLTLESGIQVRLAATIPALLSSAPLVLFL